MSPAAHADAAAWLHATLDKLRAIDPAGLAPLDRDDRDMLMAAIDGDLLEEESIQGWRHDPDTYVSLASGALFSLIERDFAPLPERLRSVIAREAAIPAMLATAARNLVDMPAPFLDIAREDLDARSASSAKDVPAAFARVKDHALQAQFAAATEASLAALRQFKAALDAAGAGGGSFVLGPERFRRLLASDLVTESPETVLAAGQAQLARDRAAFLDAEKRVDPAHPEAALALIGRDHPSAAELIGAAHDQLAQLRAFVVAHDIVTLPSDALPVVIATPDFERATLVAALDSPGPFETRATTAYFYVTPPDPKDGKAMQEQYLAYLNRPLLENTAVHEAMPGHYLQFLTQQAHPNWSLARKMGRSYTATEGWAHYTEQMMLEEGLGGGDPKWRLAQLQDAMLRDCRLIVSIGMHTQGMSLAAATTLMRDECFQPDPVAGKEARRGTEDPGYFSFTLGKLEILKLRADVRQAEGPELLARPLP